MIALGCMIARDSRTDNAPSSYFCRAEMRMRGDVSVLVGMVACVGRMTTIAVRLAGQSAGWRAVTMESRALRELRRQVVGRAGC